MNGKNIKIYRIALIASLVLAAAAAVVLSLAYGDYDEKLQHFPVDAALPVIGYVLAALAAVPAIASAVIARLSSDARLKLHESKRTTADLLYPRFTLAAAFLALFIYSLLTTLKSENKSVLAVVASVFAFCSALAFLARGFAPKNMKVTAVLSLFPIGWSVFSILDVYFSKELALNSPVKSVMLVAYIYMIVFFISEARFANRRQVVPFFVFASLASAASLSVTVPILVTAMKKAIAGDSPIPSMPLMSAIVLVIISVFALIRTVDTAKGHLVPHDPVKELENIEEEAALEAEENGEGSGK